MKNKATKIKDPQKQYFTQEHEQAILDFVASTDPRKRNELYVNIIQPAFAEMVQKIVFKYKFTNLPNIKNLISECESHLVTVLSKFDQSKGSAAFSYFSVITKNWFTGIAKKNKLQSKREVILDAQIDHNGTPRTNNLKLDAEKQYLSVENEYIENSINQEFIDSLKREIKNWESLNLKENEIKILKAINILLDQAENIEIFSKKAFYIYLREITGLNTKQILSNLNKFRQLYAQHKKNWLNEE